MATIKVVVKDVRRDSRAIGRRMVISRADGKYVLGAPMAPVNIRYYGYGLTWAEIPRPGTMPYLLKESWKLPKISFTLPLYDEFNVNRDWTKELKEIGYMVSSENPVSVRYGGYFEHRIWRITNFEFESLRRHPITNVITQASVELELTMTSDYIVNVGPVTGGVKR